MPVSVFDMQSLQHLWGTDELRSIFSEENRIQKWLDFEAALAAAQAELGIIPAAAAKEIAAEASIKNIDITAMSTEIRRIKHSLVPALKQLQAHCSKENGEWVHYGATTQDVVDTGVALQLKEFHAVAMRDLKAVGNELAKLAVKHRDTLMVGRTHGVQALPITFGHKCAVWLDEIGRHHERLVQAAPRVLVGMLAGAVGSQASLGPKAIELEKLMLEKLGLGVPTISWAPARDRFTEYTSLLAMIGATLSKIGNELFNMQRNEFGEIEEGFSEGKLGSSTMPHKRNPVAAMTALAAAVRAPQRVAALLAAMPQEHERGLGNWQAELAEFGGLLASVHGALAALTLAADGLQVFPARMRANIDALQGLVFAEALATRVAREIGKSEAHHWVEGLSRETVARGAHLRDVALQSLHGEARLRGKITAQELAALFDADAPAAHASALAAPQLAALATQADELRRDPPWRRHLPESRHGS
jgi:adenylosuccinate lyase